MALAVVLYWHQYKFQDGDLRRLPAVLLEVDLLGGCLAGLAAGVEALPLPLLGPFLAVAPAALLAKGVTLGVDLRMGACRLREGCMFFLVST